MNRNIKIAIIIGSIVILLFVGLPLLTSGIGWGNNSGYCGTGSGMMGLSGWGWIWPLLMVLFWGFVIWAIVSFIKGSPHFSQIKNLHGQNDTALELLKKRYAAGEISREEFEHIKSDLS